MTNNNKAKPVSKIKKSKFGWATSVNCDLKRYIAPDVNIIWKNADTMETSAVLNSNILRKKGTVVCRKNPNAPKTQTKTTPYSWCAIAE